MACLPWKRCKAKRSSSPGAQRKGIATTMKQDVFEKIDAHNIISFDIFDTLVVRNVLSPTDIFSVVQLVYNQMYQDEPIHGYREKRINAEKKARFEKKAEITFQEIFDAMDGSDLVKTRLMDIELETEYDFLVPNPEIMELYSYAVKKQKRIVICSDMYLSAAFLKKVLQKNGVDTYDGFFVSSESGYRKKNGTLFRYMCSCLNCKPQKILHIGDNKASDYQKALENGLHAVRVEKEDLLYHLRKGGISFDKVNNSVAAGIISNHGYRASACKKLGMQILGMPLVGFCQWIHSQASEKQKYFLARDGYLIQRVYEILYPDEISNCHYLYLSRKSLKAPCVYAGVDYPSVVEQFPKLKKYDVETFCLLLNLDEGRSRQYSEKFCYISPVSSRQELAESKAFRDLFLFIKEQENSFFEEQYRLFTDYLKQEGFDKDSVVIDVGWRASAQVNICKILNTSAIQGYYFGVEEAVTNSDIDTSRMHGYFWSWDGATAVKKTLLSGRKGIFEIMFLSDQGSTVRYEKDGDAVRPVLEASGNEQVCIQELQSGCLCFAEAFSHYQKRIGDFDACDVSLPLNDFMLYPTQDDLCLGDAVCENYRIAFLAKPNSKTYYLSHAKELVRDFMGSEWKVGFLVRLFNPGRMLQKALNALYEMRES